MNDILILVKRLFEEDGFTLKQESRHEVFCRLASIGQQEFYMAQTTDFRPELKFILEDSWEYENEELCIFEGTWYRIIRTYKVDQGLELVVQCATDEEVGVVE